jgi:glc operon protein GlcG
MLDRLRRSTLLKKSALFLAAALAAALAGAAEPPASGPAAAGQAQMAPVYGPAITLAQAKRVLAAAEVQAAKMHAESAVFAIVQPSGALVLFEKMDESTYVSIEFAQAKARTAAITRRPTGGGPGGAPPTPDLIGLRSGRRHGHRASRDPRSRRRRRRVSGALFTVVSYCDTVKLKYDT